MNYLQDKESVGYLSEEEQLELRIPRWLRKVGKAVGVATAATVSRFLLPVAAAAGAGFVFYKVGQKIFARKPGQKPPEGGVPVSAEELQKAGVSEVAVPGGEAPGISPLGAPAKKFPWIPIAIGAGGLLLITVIIIATRKKKKA